MRDKPADLRRLAGALPALERDETAAADIAAAAVRRIAHLSFFDTYLRKRIVAYSRLASSARRGNEPTATESPVVSGRSSASVWPAMILRRATWAPSATGAINGPS